MISQDRFADLNHHCRCGARYVVVSKEIPLPNDEQLSCVHCGRELKGRWSSRYFDYEPHDDAA
ncbi:hypothetical protein [Bradyrhizobium canariense]|uniref:hypothetical protein n=1 Tax=Bradyrhizobium canariense TaxID=255045 RepID=UPI001B8A698A|nr:hypothetical protein [Bradyrhizobium canariense]MBR0955341.1 hypothetical protein [Bradyrhizobium canariense]